MALLFLVSSPKLPNSYLQPHSLLNFRITKMLPSEKTLPCAPTQDSPDLHLFPVQSSPQWPGSQASTPRPRLGYQELWNSLPNWPRGHRGGYFLPSRPCHQCRCPAQGQPRMGVEGACTCPLGGPHPPCNASMFSLGGCSWWWVKKDGRWQAGGLDLSFLCIPIRNSKES